MEFFRRLDRRWARGESAFIVAILIAMVLVTAWMALIRNLARVELSWAAHLLENMFWTDAFLRTATLWLAFLGASQATYHHKHIRIELIPERLPPRARNIVRAIVGIGSGLTMFALTISLGLIVDFGLHELPLDYGILGEQGVIHVCDASASELAAVTGVEVPNAFCIVRKVFGALGITAEGPLAVSRILLPLMFAVIGLRFLGAGIGAAAEVSRR